MTNANDNANANNATATIAELFANAVSGGADWTAPTKPEADALRREAGQKASSEAVTAAQLAAMGECATLGEAAPAAIGRVGEVVQAFSGNLASKSAPKVQRDPAEILADRIAVLNDAKLALLDAAGIDDESLLPAGTWGTENPEKFGAKVAQVVKVASTGTPGTIGQRDSVLDHIGHVVSTKGVAMKHSEILAEVSDFCPKGPKSSGTLDQAWEAVTNQTSARSMDVAEKYSVEPVTVDGDKAWAPVTA